MPLEPAPGASEEETRISTEIAALHDASFGRVHHLTTLLVADVVMCLIELPLLISEETLLAGGVAEDHICETRRQFEHSVGASMTAVVEHSTGREVIGFFTDAQLEPPLTVTVFRLAPARV
jgi:uncharacterized protein YbcI